MTLSRTSRILLGVLLLSLAAFLWVNFLVKDSNLDLGFLRAASGSDVAPTQPAVAPLPQSQVERDLEILDLPFLVTEPPVEPEPAADETAAEETQAAGEATRRATVNPFSPIISRGAGAGAGERPSTAETSGTPGTTVTRVPVPSGPASTANASTAPKAPAPAAKAPGSRQDGATLPRALPGGTLGGTPPLLRSAIGATDIPEGGPARMAALREPTPESRDLDQAGDVAPRRSEPLPLTGPIDQNADGRERGGRAAGQAPLAAGTSPLSRYLRDNNVRFTGSVIGPVSVGVFRSSLTAAPVVITLGQALPETEIVLTDLRGQQAEFTFEDSTQTLTLELRR